MKTSVLLVALLAVVSLPTKPLAAFSQAYSADRHLLSVASASLSQTGRGPVLSWLRGQKEVRSAATGRDGKTLDIYFKDGLHAAILPAARALTHLGALQSRVRLAAPAGQGPRAAVFMPFASELGLGPGAGDVEVTDLQQAGFTVDQAYDTQVTVGLMASLSRYNVVYMLTHTGLGARGEGLVATGELYGSDSSLASYLQEGSVMAAGVAGSTDVYYAITPTFVSRHMGQFPTDSLLFVNGCALLPATPFWQALSSRGLTSLVSWDNDVQTKDDFLTAAAFFNVLGQGKSVADTISTLLANGYGSSTSAGQTATIGYRGDGSLTLQRARRAGGAGGPAPSTPTATPSRATPVLPTATVPSRPTPRPTATRTPVATHPPVVPLTALRPSVKPGSSQTVTIRHLKPASSVHVDVRFPNGDLLHADRTADQVGTADYSYIQPSSTITRHDALATVTVRAATVSGETVLTLHYRITFGPLDVTVEPRVAPPGATTSIYLHSRPRTHLVAVAVPPKGKRTRYDVTAGKSGWVHVRYRIPRGLAPGTTVAVRARTRLSGKAVHTGTTFKVL